MTDFLINVKRDFGAQGDNVSDDTIALQNAITAAVDLGGKLIFPRGRYLISNSLLVPGGHYSSLVFEGDGGYAGMTGSCIVGNFNDWLIKNGHAQTNCPLHGFLNLGFQQNYQGPFGPDTEHTAGCINWGSGLGGYIKGCNIDIWTGIGVYADVDCIEIANCNVTGHYIRSGEYEQPHGSFDSIGAWCCGHVHGGKWTSLKYGLVMSSAGGAASNMMIDTCLYGLVLGEAPMGWIENPMEAGWPVMHPAGWTYLAKSANVRNISMESCFHAINIGRAANVFVEGCQMASYQAEPLAGGGLVINDFCDRSTFKGITISGAYANAGVVLGSEHGQGRAAGTKFIAVNSFPSTGRGWSFKGGDINTRVLSGDSTGADPIVFENCPLVDDAINVGQLPSSPSSMWLQQVKDSADPIWTGSGSNVGKPVTGGGANRAYVRWNGTQWILAG